MAVKKAQAPEENEGLYSQTKPTIFLQSFFGSLNFIKGKIRAEIHKLNLSFFGYWYFIQGPVI
jgi:hypothetical protein